MVGATSAPTMRATRSATPVGRTTSTLSGRCGPCCSVAPSGRMTGVLAAAFFWNSGQDSSAMKTLSTISSPSVHRRAAVDGEALPGHEARTGAGEEDDRGGDLLRLREPPERVGGLELAQLRPQIGEIEERRVGRTGRHRIDQDPRRELARPRPRQRQDGALGRAIDGEAGATEIGELGGDVDDPAAGAE